MIVSDTDLNAYLFLAVQETVNTNSVFSYAARSTVM